MRNFFSSLLHSLIRDAVLVVLGTLVLGLLGWGTLGLTLTEAFAGALTLCVALWLFARFIINA